jgi:cytochrome oxidase assembly protein ShyY1
MWNKNDPENNIWRTRDVAEMAAAIKTAPIFIDEVKSNFYNFVKVLVYLKI